LGSEDPTTRLSRPRFIYQSIEIEASGLKLTKPRHNTSLINIDGILGLDPVVFALPDIKVLFDSLWSEIIESTGLLTSP